MHDPAPDPAPTGIGAPTALWSLTDPGAPEAASLEREADPALRRLLAAVREGAAEFLPPVVEEGPDGVLMPVAAPLGEADARRLAHTLTSPAFAPFTETLNRLERWCRTVAPRFPVLRDGLLAPANDALFGPLLCEVFVACAERDPAAARGYAALRTGQFEAATVLFLDRITRDTAGPDWPEDPALSGPVTALRAHGEETHLGGQRVLRVTFDGGGEVAYKPRPASGEVLLCAPEDSLFALLNALPPVSGAIRLPTLRAWRGGGADDRAYLWQEWVHPPRQQGVLRSEGGWQLTGTVLTPDAADRYWHRAGALTAVCYALGIVDLHGDNVLTGPAPTAPGSPSPETAGEPEAMLFPIDVECCFFDTGRLTDTGLVHHPRARTQHHCGLEDLPRWCGPAGPLHALHRTPGGDLRLHRRTRPMGRTETRSVVGDTEGNTGYARYLPAMLRGMFDAWTILCEHRGTIREFLRSHGPGHVVRVIPRQTGEYIDAMAPTAPGHEKPEHERPGPEHQGGEHQGPEHEGGEREASDPSAEPFGSDEERQLARGDVPYFHRGLDSPGGPLLTTVPPPGPSATEKAAAVSGDSSRWPPSTAVVSGEKWTLGGLATAIRDAVAYVVEEPAGTPEGETAPGRPDHGVRLRLHHADAGQAVFDWPERDRWLSFEWSSTTAKLRIGAAASPVPAPEEPPAEKIRRHLLRLDASDAPLRAAWRISDFTDTALEDRLDRLTGDGLRWLRDVVDQHGWPGRGFVGDEAAGAAIRLLQHARCASEEDTTFRWRCLELITEAAESGDALPRDVAYVTDALRLAEGRPQVYGTKFERHGDTLHPCPIEQPDTVDDRRAELGMETLAEHTARTRATFPLTASAS